MSAEFDNLLKNLADALRAARDGTGGDLGKLKAIDDRLQIEAKKRADVATPVKRAEVKEPESEAKPAAHVTRGVRTQSAHVPPRHR